MYGFVLPTLLLICLGINNSVHCRSINETVSGEPDITDFPSTTVNLLDWSARNCSDQDLDNSFMIYSNCLDSAFNGNDIESSLSNSTSDVTGLLKKSCEDASQCLHNSSLTLDEMCVENNKVRDEKNKYIAINNWLSFWCQDYGSHLTKFYLEGGPNCLKNETEALDNCLKVYPADITKKTCNMITETLVCVDGVFQKCQLRNSTINLFESSFDVLYEMKGCPVYRSNQNQTQI